MHLDIYTMSRYIVKAMYRKAKTSYNLEWKEYLFLESVLVMEPGSVGGVVCTPTTQIQVRVLLNLNLGAYCLFLLIYNAHLVPPRLVELNYSCICDNLENVLY